MIAWLKNLLRQRKNAALKAERETEHEDDKYVNTLQLFNESLVGLNIISYHICNKCQSRNGTVEHATIVQKKIIEYPSNRNDHQLFLHVQNRTVVGPDCTSIGQITHFVAISQYDKCIENENSIVCYLAPSPGLITERKITIQKNNSQEIPDHGAYR